MRYERDAFSSAEREQPADRDEKQARGCADPDDRLRHLADLRGPTAAVVEVDAAVPVKLKPSYTKRGGLSEPLDLQLNCPSLSFDFCCFVTRVSTSCGT